jgi:hypothetical protein
MTLTNPELESSGISWEDCGDIYIGGQFTRWSTDEYIAKPPWQNTNQRYHIFDRCVYCGGNVVVGVDACSHCGAPTKDWWRYLDRMLEEWKYRARGPLLLATRRGLNNALV